MPNPYTLLIASKALSDIDFSCAFVKLLFLILTDDFYFCFLRLHLSLRVVRRLQSNRQWGAYELTRHSVKRNSKCFPPINAPSFQEFRYHRFDNPAQRARFPNRTSYLVHRQQPTAAALPIGGAFSWDGCVFCEGGIDKTVGVW